MKKTFTVIALLVVFGAIGALHPIADAIVPIVGAVVLVWVVESW